VNGIPDFDNQCQKPMGISVDSEKQRGNVSGG
jgi:hypothetical protein